jgi:hypothetical protein
MVSELRTVAKSAQLQTFLFMPVPFGPTVARQMGLTVREESAFVMNGKTRNIGARKKFLFSHYRK